MPSGVVIRYLEAKKDAGGTEEKFLDYLDAENAIAILGQTLTSNVGKVGSFAAAKIHDLVRKDILVSDISMVESYINDLWIKPLVDINYGKVEKYPKWRVVQKDTIDYQVMMQVIEGLPRNGFKTVPVSWLHQIFGIPIPAEGEETLQPSPILAPGAGKSDNFSERQGGNVEYYLEQLRTLNG